MLLKAPFAEQHHICYIIFKNMLNLDIQSSVEALNPDSSPKHSLWKGDAHVRVHIIAVPLKDVTLSHSQDSKGLGVIHGDAYGLPIVNSCKEMEQISDTNGYCC